MKLKDRAVLITGASSGIGWETALAFAEAGAKVALTARRVEKLEELKAKIEGNGGHALAIRCDVQNQQDVETAVKQTTAAFGRLDVLVNNAGLLAVKKLEDQSTESVEEIMRTNYFGVVYAIKAALPIMTKQGNGHIVNVSSVAGLMGLPLMSAYCASKFAVVGLTESMRREYYGTGVTFTSFCPGSVDTPMVADILHSPDGGVPVKAKTPRQVAEQILKCVRKRTPEQIYAEAPGFVFKLARFFPRLADWGIQKAFKKFHPLAKK